MSTLTKAKRLAATHTEKIHLRLRPELIEPLATLMADTKQPGINRVQLVNEILAQHLLGPDRSQLVFVRLAQVGQQDLDALISSVQKLREHFTEVRLWMNTQRPVSVTDLDAQKCWQETNQKILEYSRAADRLVSNLRHRIDSAAKVQPQSLATFALALKNLRKFTNSMQEPTKTILLRCITELDALVSIDPT